MQESRWVFLPGVVLRKEAGAVDQKCWGDRPQEALRFLMAGFSNTALTLLIYWALLPFTGYRPAYVAAFIAGFFFLAVVNARYVFQTSFKSRNFAAFAMYQLCYFAAFGALLAVTVESLGISSALAPLVVLTVVTPVNFLATRLIFRFPGRNSASRIMET